MNQREKDRREKAAREALAKILVNLGSFKTIERAREAAAVMMCEEHETPSAY